MRAILRSGLCFALVAGATLGCAELKVDHQRIRDLDGGPHQLEDAGSSTVDKPGPQDALPGVRITSPKSGASVKAGTIRIEGEASDDRGVAAVLVSVGPNVALAASSDDNFRHFSLESPVPNGMFAITAKARDTGGQPSAAAVVHVIGPIAGTDDAAPTIVIAAPADGSSPLHTNVLVTGSASDDRAVTVVELRRRTRVAGKDWGVVETLGASTVQTDDFFASWAALVTLEPGKENELTFVARDAADHEGTAKITLLGRAEADRDPPSLTVKTPKNGAMLDAAQLSVTGTANDNVGVREVKLRIGTADAAGTVAWGEYQLTTSDDLFATWTSGKLDIPVGAFALEVKAIDVNGLATTRELGVINNFVLPWTEEVALPLRLNPPEAPPVLHLELDRSGVNDVIAADIQKDIELLQLDTTDLISDAVTQIKNSCGTDWTKDSENPNHNCLTAYGANWKTSPEYSMVRILTMTPANVVVDGTSIADLKDLADGLDVGGGFRQILSETLGISRTTAIVSTPGVVSALQDYWMSSHPAVLPGAKLSITMYDAMQNLAPLADRFGPVTTGSRQHPGVIDPSFRPYSKVFGDDFKMVLVATSNLQWMDGIDVSNAKKTPAKEYIALVVDNTGTPGDVLEFDFTDPAKFDVQGLTASPKVDLRMRLVENSKFVPACVAGASTCQPNLPSRVPPLAGYVWANPKYEIETTVTGAALFDYAGRDGYSKTYPAVCLGPLCIIQDGARVDVGVGSEPAGWATFTTFVNLGNPPPPQYLWELISEVAQVALHKPPGSTIAEGSANVAFTLKQVDVGLTASEIRTAIRPELQKQRAKLSDKLLGNYKANNGAVDLYYRRGADGKPYVFFVDDSDPLPDSSYSYSKVGFFAEPELTNKVSKTAIASSGDTAHEKLALPEGDTTVYMRDESTGIFRLRFVVGSDADEIAVYVARKVL